MKTQVSRWSILFVLVCISLIGGNNRVIAQQECPPWAQQRLAEIQLFAIQAGYEYGMTNDLGTYKERIQLIEEALSGLPKACIDQLQAQQGPQDQLDRMRCRQLWDAFNRCESDFKYKLAGGLNPAYTCQRPQCSY